MYSFVFELSEAVLCSFTTKMYCKLVLLQCFTMHNSSQGIFICKLGTEHLIFEAKSG